MKSQEEISKMTPLARARYMQTLPPPPPREDCITCVHCVKVGRAHFCDISEKMLLDIFLEIGRCMHVPSDYKAIEDKEKELWLNE